MNTNSLFILLNELSSIEQQLQISDQEYLRISDKYVQSIDSNIDQVNISLLAEICVSLSTSNADLAILAGRLTVYEIHLNNNRSFSENIEYISNKYDNFFSLRFLQSVSQYKKILDKSIKSIRDYSYDYFAIKTLIRTHLINIKEELLETPQFALMRVAVEIGGSIEHIINTYESMSNKYYTHATPTIINAGKIQNQLSSCFLITNKSDSLEGIMDTCKMVAQISSSSGGIGLAVHNVRASGSHIYKSGGTSKGLLPLFKTYNELAKWWDQGGGKRKGAFAIYLEPWHADVFDLLDLRKNHGIEERRARDLFTALWTNDLFMERVESDGDWTLMCPNECPGLSDCYGEEFRALYTRYEKENKGRKTIKAQELWFAILESQIETGTPYMLYKDACNEKSNQKNLGTIKSSNLCTEIVEYTAPDEVAVCNLASIALPKFVEKGKFDFDKLFEITYQATINLNRIIDNNYYPVPEAKNSNLRHRPIGLGVQGLADAFILMRYPFTSDEAKQLNKDIFETIYYAALTASKDLAKVEGPYQTYKGSPISQGIFQFDMWGAQASNRWEWDVLRDEIKEHGVRNSLLVAPMPTASTSQILGNNECFEPYTSNIYSRRTLSGEFPVVNKHLLKDLVKLGLWSDSMKNRLIAANGSIQDFPEVPNNIKELYRTVWEIKQKDILDMAADRGAFIDQSQSLNIFIDSPNFAKLTSMHFYAWKKGLKTGMYYLRTKAARDAIQFTVDKASLQEPVVAVSKDQREAEISCSLDNPEGCEMCGS